MSFVRRYLFSTDHRVVGQQYFYLSLLSVFIGMALSWLMRVHLVWPQAGGVMTPERYLSVMTIHGTIMVFFVLTTAPQSAFGNLFIPAQIGAKRMAFPLLSALSFWTTAAALLTLLLTFVIPDGPPISGWTAYPPLSAVGQDAGPGLGAGQTLWVISIALFCVAAVISSINFIATILDMRTRGMSMIRLPLTCWSWFITAILILLSFPVLLVAGVLLLMDRLGGTSFFVPAGLMINDKLQAHSGGSPILWQHLFWFFGHPEVYIAIVPGFGIVSHILATSARKPILGYRPIVLAMSVIGFLSFAVWGHHMFVSGMNPFSVRAFAIPTLAISIPSAIIVMLWLGTIWGGKLRFTTPMMFCLGFISVFISGGLGGFFLAQPSLDVYLHATYFVVAHFHLIMGVAAVFAIFAATYYWFPKMYGRMMSERLGQVHFWITFIGCYAIFMPMHYLGLAGNVRRYSAFVDNYMVAMIPLHQFITVAALIVGAAQFVFFYNFFSSMKAGAAADANPWQSTSLEWTHQDEVGESSVVVTRDPYELGLTGERDFAMQNESEAKS